MKNLLLQEATFDDIMRELVSRHPGGVLVVCAKPSEGEEGVWDDDMKMGYHKLFPSLGMAKIALGVLSKAAMSGLGRRDIEEELGDEAEGD